MNPHFFTAPFYFAFIWFRVQGSGFKVQDSGFKVQGSGFRVLVAASPPFLKMVFSYRQPSPRGEGAPQGRIGHWRYEREREGVSQAGDL
ncbi:MAG: hypothetical protein EGR19_06150 [Dialister sp.]|nr:hypothetical protein [Dialister sp.]